MTATEILHRQALMTVLRTKEQGYVLPKVPKEDIQKGKQERVLPARKWRPISADMRGGISEALKENEDFVEALKRGAHDEYGLYIQNGQLMGEPRHFHRKVDQLRNGQLNRFDVFWQNLLLHPNQVEMLEDKIVLSASEAVDQLKKLRTVLRPSMYWILVTSLYLERRV